MSYSDRTEARTEALIADAYANGAAALIALRDLCNLMAQRDAASHIAAAIHDLVDGTEDEHAAECARAALDEPDYANPMLACEGVRWELRQDVLRDLNRQRWAAA